MRLERDGARLVRWVYNVRPEDRIYEKELNTSLKLNSMREWLQDRRLEWFGDLERMEENFWFKVSCSFLKDEGKKERRKGKESHQEHS